jgi:hypothetical protein
MNIFVNSRGYGGDADYQWHAINQGGEQPVGIPPMYRRYMHESMIYPEDESYVLGRFGNELVLLITGMLSPSRKDFLQRAIHDSLLLVGSQADEAVLRGIAARALADNRWLPALLDLAIVFDDEAGFKVRWNLVASMLEADGVGNAPPERTPAISRLSDIGRQELAAELVAKKLPSYDGFLVVVTTIQSLQQLANAGIWRGMAKGLKSEQDWESRTQWKWRLW